MTKNNAIVAVFNDHRAAEDAVRRLAEGGLDIKNFSIVGKGYHSEEKIVGFYNAEDRIMFWGKNGAMWGGLWGLFFGGILMTIPVVGSVVVLGHLAAMVFAAIEGAVVVGGLSAVGAAIFSIGIPKNSVIEYEAALKTDALLVVAHGPVDEMERAKTILEGMEPARLDLHEDVKDMAKPTTGHAGHTAHAA